MSCLKLVVPSKSGIICGQYYYPKFHLHYSGFGCHISGTTNCFAIAVNSVHLTYATSNCSVQEEGAEAGLATRWTEQGGALVVAVSVEEAVKRATSGITIDQEQMGSTDKVLVKKEYFPAINMDREMSRIFQNK